MRLPIAALAILSIASAGMVHAATPMACRVDVRSAQGGRVWMTKSDPSPKLPFDMPQQVFWQPLSSTEAIEMVVGGRGGKALDALTGGHVTFTPQVAADASQYTVRVRSDLGETWSYGPGDVEAGADKSEAYLDWNDLRGAAILTALSYGRRLTVEIVVGDNIEQSETFDPSNTGERDKLVAYASHLVETNDPRVCRPI